MSASYDYISVGRCPDCGKARYRSRKGALKAAQSGRPVLGVRAYQCGDYWHLGHLPKAVRRGRLDRDYRKPETGQ